jgi:hypothetical protein
MFFRYAAFNCGFFEIGLKNELIFEEERFLSVLVSYENKENVII